MGRIYSHLCREERQTPARRREAGIPVVEIVARLGRAPSTLYRELARNRIEDPDGRLEIRRRGVPPG